jgi:c-di-GMP-binding flagellar brake protein YcgR
MPDHRRHRRIAIDRRVGITRCDGQVEYARACNLSAGGMAIKTPRKIDPGSTLDLFFHLSVQRDIKRIRARGKVVYLHYVGPEGQFQVGVEFRELSAEHKGFIESFILQRLNRIP